MSGSSITSLQALRDRPMVFVDDLELLQLDESDHHHLQRSLRVRPGAVITAADGAGGWRPVRFGEELEIDGPVVHEQRPLGELTIGFAPVKGDRPELVVQKLTELGVDQIVPLLTERSVVRWDEARAAKNLERHRRIVREAAMQSRNPWLPAVEPLMPLEEFLSSHPDAVLADPAGSPLEEHRFPSSEAAVAVGPEGGFSPDELAGRQAILLPGRILRTETAAITAGVLLAAERAVNARRG